MTPVNMMVCKTRASRVIVLCPFGDVPVLLGVCNGMARFRSEALTLDGEHVNGLENRAIRGLRVQTPMLGMGYRDSSLFRAKDASYTLETWRIFNAVYDMRVVAEHSRTVIVQVCSVSQSTDALTRMVRCSNLIVLYGLTTVRCASASQPQKVHTFDALSLLA